MRLNVAAVMSNLLHEISMFLSYFVHFSGDISANVTAIATDTAIIGGVMTHRFVLCV